MRHRLPPGELLGFALKSAGDWPINRAAVMFETELAYFIAHQEELVALHAGKTLLLRGASVVGAYDSPLAAYLDGQRKFAAGTFMIQPCEPGPSAYTVAINSSATL